MRLHKQRAVCLALLLAAVLVGGCRTSKHTLGATFGTSDADAPEASGDLVCAPSDVEPKPVVQSPPMPTGQAACSQTAIDALFDACFLAGGDCAAWKAANGRCDECVFTPEAAVVQGPFIMREHAKPKVNQRGCLDSLSPGCGSAYEAAHGCTRTACDGNSDCKGATPAELAACRQKAMRQSCRPLLDEFTARCGEGGLTNKRMCFPPNGGEPAMRSFISMLASRACGPGGVR